MEETRVLPALSEDGWVSNPIKKADYMLSHFFCSDYSQSYIYYGHVASLPWILQQNQGNIGQTCSQAQQVLSVYFSRYFDNVVVEVTEEPNPSEPSKGQIALYIKFTDIDGNEIVVGKMLRIADTTIEKIINISNG